MPKRKVNKRNKNSGGNIDWGFDLTGFGSRSGANKWKRIIKENNLKGGDRVCKNNLCGFVWKGSGLKVVTGNNPITGEFRDKDGRTKEKGYASYIGISGTPNRVIRFVKSVRKNANTIKGEDCLDNSFIWV